MSTNRFGKFVQEPSLQQYLRLRRRVMGTRRYDPHGRVLSELQMQRERGTDAEEVGADEILRRGRELASTFRLSPRYHYLMGQASLEAGQMEDAFVHRDASRACLEAILSTGDGTADSPYVITYLTDENDVALALKLHVRCRSVVQSAARMLDVITLHDGQELWFDVSDLLAPQLELIASSAASNV